MQQHNLKVAEYCVETWTTLLSQTSLPPKIVIHFNVCIFSV